MSDQPYERAATGAERALQEETLRVGVREAVWGSLCDAGEQVGLRIAGEQASQMTDIAVRRLTHVFEFRWRPGNNLERSVRLGLIAGTLVGMRKADAVRRVLREGAQVAVRDNHDACAYTDEYESNRITITVFDGIVTHANDG